LRLGKELNHPPEFEPLSLRVADVARV